MKKKGFTLIELLAVIVILAIIALIITPIISNVIDASRKAAFKESVDGIIDSTASYVHEYILANNDDFRDYPVVFTCDGNSCKTTNNEILTFKGNVPKSGRIIMQDGGVLAEYITDGKYCAYGYKWDLVVENSCGEVDATKPNIEGTQSGKVVTLTMTDNESGVHSYCATTENDLSTCNWIVPSNASSEEYEIPSAGRWYFFAKDNKGNVSDGIDFTTTSNDYCPYIIDPVALEKGSAGSQAFTVPIGCAGTYKLEVWGAQGGGTTLGGSGANGGYSRGNITLAEGETIYAVVGGQGGAGGGGYNGGGGSAGGVSGGGGGATHIGRQNATLASTSSNNVLIVAGGGGGCGYWTDAGLQFLAGGVGGGTSGVTSGRGAQGGTQNGGYAYGQGGQGSGYNGAAGGGGGWYGGNGIVGNDGGGGGGSGYIGGVSNGETFTGAQSVPTHDGASTMTGNSGAGYAKISLVSLN